MLLKTAKIRGYIYIYIYIYIHTYIHKLIMRGALNRGALKIPMSWVLPKVRELAKYCRCYHFNIEIRVRNILQTLALGTTQKVLAVEAVVTQLGEPQLPTKRLRLAAAGQYSKSHALRTRLERTPWLQPPRL